MPKLELVDLYEGFRNPEVIRAFAARIAQKAQKLEKTFRIMEVCGGHTHTLMKYGLTQLLPANVEFIHGPGCPVCIMPKERVDHAYTLVMMPDVILVTLGDMIKVPGSLGSLQDARARGADVRYVYSPLDVLAIARENPAKKIIFFAIGFETTTPMTAALLEALIAQGIENVALHINHVTVPQAMHLLLADGQSAIDAFVGPSHVSVITGSKIYAPFPRDYGTPVVVAGFEPVDMMEAIEMLIDQRLEGRSDLEVQYKRLVSFEGNVRAQSMVERYMEPREHFRWRGIGDIAQSALKLRAQFAAYDAEVLYASILPNTPIDDHRLCICGTILRGQAKPHDCKVFGTACKPSSPLGSCMVSSEGACAAYYRYGTLKM
ncbi:MAG: hydrogenase formation protein HypD [Sulfuricurvum sp. PC08-66]|nr:MAG: hydrogenase formation protein HypD [Sulfuricurvum sp. PC08-66]